MRMSGSTLACVIVAFLGLSLLGGVFVLASRTPKRPAEVAKARPPAAPREKQAPKWRPSRGEEAILYESAEGTVLVAATEADNKTLTRACTAGDTLGIKQMIRSGRVLECEPKTRVLVMGGGVLVIEVRILGGVHVGKSGLVDREFVREAE